MSAKTVLARWFSPHSIVERINSARRGKQQHSAVPDSAWRWWGFRRDIGILAEDAYEKVGWVYGCVRAISRNVQQVPFMAVRSVPGRGKGRIERLPDSHPLAQLLARPNEEDDMSGILEAISTHLELRGEGFLELDGELPGADGNPRPAYIYARPPEWIWKVDVKNDRYTAFHMRLPQYSSVIDIPGNKGVLFKYFNPRDPWRGLAPMKAAYQAADTYYAAQMFNSNFFQMGGIPSLVIGFDKNSPYREFNKDVRERLRAEMEIFYSGIHSGRRVAVLEPGMVMLSDGSKTKDIDFAKLLAFEKTEILAVFQVPPIELGEVENANRSNSDNQRRMFWQEKIVPIVEDFVGLFNKKISPRFGAGCFVQPDFSQVPALRQNLAELAGGVIPWVSSGIMTINEARKDYLDRDPVPWGDEPYNPQTGMNSDGGEPDTPPDPNETDDTGGKISPDAVRQMLAEWKNAAISRVRDGARRPLDAFPPYREAKKAARKFGVPLVPARELARALSIEMALAWNTLTPEDGLADLFDQTTERIPKGQEQ